MIDVDVLVIGSGFSGSITALALRSRGRRVAIVERGQHPRFAIGESSTPLANLLIEELADRYDLPTLKSFSKWGTWQRSNPEVACGLKRGFTFFFHQLDAAFPADDDHRRQLMVAASPHDDIADTHWYRPDFDHALIRDAQESGASYFDNTSIDGIRWEGDRAVVDAQINGTRLTFRAGFVVDASGPRGALYRMLALGDAPFKWLPPTEGLYTHFKGVKRWDSLVTTQASTPYPVDDAAVHQVFPGGWIWILRFNNGITSAGAALATPLAAAIGARDGAAAWTRLMSRLPSVARQFEDAKPAMPFIHTPTVAFRCSRVAGPGWALLPSAAGVIDPLLSTGFPLTLLGVSRLVEILAETSPGPARERALQEYERTTLAELDATESLVAALYATMDDPLLFKKLALLYFAAASFAEAARRLGSPSLAPGFLLRAHAHFGPGALACVTQALQRPIGKARLALIDEINRLVEPFDVAGLLDSSRRDWFPVLASDLTANAFKLRAGPDQIAALLRRSGFVA